MKYSSMMTSKGQVTIPADIRRKLGLKPGQPVRFSVSGDTVSLGAQDWRKGLEELHQRAAAHMKRRKLRPLSDEELDAAINEAVEGEATARYRRSLNG
jgi:AbrB family looped-hinge helix DNA binding protein